ncbi:hypothetical protein [Mycobacterium dioxanotrophicus]|nr:hypothetical protein [Mycobacterium dioxanotrophicus]
MIRRFFTDGTCWLAIAFLIIIGAVYGLYFTPPDTTTIVWMQP